MLRIRSTSAWISCALVLLLLPACVSADKYMRLENEYGNLQDQLAYVQDQLAQAEAALASGDMTAEELDELRQQYAALQAEKQALAAQFEEIQSRNAGLKSAGFDTFMAGNNMVGFRGKSDVFFASGQDTLTAEGKAALDALIRQELANSSSVIQVVGHTDTDPINKTKDKYPKGNIQLGVMRALSVRDYLVEKGIDAARISITSWGEYQPLVDARTAEAKARNRRVEILVPIAG